MENEIRYYVKQMLACMADEEDMENFEPTYLITAVRLPTGAIGLTTNTGHIKEKLEYILEAYDDDMYLKTNGAIQMLNLMVV